MINARHTLRIPNIKGCEIKYYYHRDDLCQQARIFPPHIHDVPEAYILTEGTACFAVENRIYRLTAGDIILTRPNEVHNCILTEATVHKHLCIWFEPSFALLDPLLEACSAEGNLISPSPEAKARLLALYDQLDKATTEQKHRREYALLCMILAEMEEGVGKFPESKFDLPHLLSEILDDIGRNFTEIESLDYFTEKYYISTSTLGRLFRQHLHTSPKLYLETKKLAHSRILLREGKSVSEACRGAGFTDVSGYIRLFRKHFGTTPGAYKRE